MVTALPLAAIAFCPAFARRIRLLVPPRLPCTFSASPASIVDVAGKWNGARDNGRTEHEAGLVHRRIVVARLRLLQSLLGKRSSASMARLLLPSTNCHSSHLAAGNLLASHAHNASYSYFRSARRCMVGLRYECGHLRESISTPSDCLRVDRTS